MSNRITFRGTHGLLQVALPFNLEEQIAGWSRVRKAMLEEVPAEFTRDEWACLANFLDAENLRLPFGQTFGECSDEESSPALLVRPRGPVSLWLPNNVSLLGPLMFIIVSLTGNPLRSKSGSRSIDLSGSFLKFAREHSEDGPLAAYLANVRHEVFSSDDPRNQEMTERGFIRIVFGSDDAAAAIHALPHPAESIGISFTDRRSEAWLEIDQCDEKALADLIKVFTVYGQAGCTSPSRVVLLNATHADAIKFRERLLTLWPSVIRRRTEMNVASDNVRSWQLARATGWDSVLVPEHGALVSVGDYALPAFSSFMELRIIPATPEEARSHLPENIQTIGHALRDARATHWLHLLSGTRVARFVPLAKMHHFDTLWDGQDFFSQLFAYMRVSA